MGHRSPLDRLAHRRRGCRRRPSVRRHQHPVRAREAPVTAGRRQPRRVGKRGGGRGPREYARRRYANSLDAARQLHARFGPRVFYLGWGVNATRECVFHAVFFSTYEHLVHGFREDAGFSPHAATRAGGVAGAAAWAGNLPLDCVKSGVQGQCLGNGGWDGRRGKVGTMEAVREVLRRGGALGFFSGATPSSRGVSS